VKAERKARIGRNPQTGEAIKIKAKTVVKFPRGQGRQGLDRPAKEVVTMDERQRRGGALGLLPFFAWGQCSYAQNAQGSFTPRDRLASENDERHDDHAQTETRTWLLSFTSSYCRSVPSCLRACAAQGGREFKIYLRGAGRIDLARAARTVFLNKSI